MSDKDLTSCSDMMLSDGSAIVPVILAGGAGSRLWPLSRENYPKQFLKLLGEKSLLQETAKLAKRVTGSSELIVITGDNHYFLCQEQLRDIGFDKVTYILEPCARNTAPAIGLAANYCQEHLSKGALMLVFPSDHLISNFAAFSKTADKSIKVAQQNNLVIYGVKPDSPKTQYGYIQRGEAFDADGYRVHRFVEKPNVNLAEAYFKQGGYYWNSGMFLFKPTVYLEELKRHSIDIYDVVTRAYVKSYLKDDFLRVDIKQFSECRSESIDYAVMEHTYNAIMIPLNAQWNDLGCWSSVAESANADSNGNILRGNVVARDSQNCFLSSEERLVTVIGLTDQVVVSTPDAVLVADKKYSQDVKKIVEQLKLDSNSIASEHKKVFRPWGYYQNLTSGPGFQVKHIMVKPGGQLSLQLHHYRAERWVVVSGEALVVNGEQVSCLYPEESTYIEKESKHRLSNRSDEELHVIEVQTGSYLGEDDIVRFEDDYDRIVADPLKA